MAPISGIVITPGTNGILDANGYLTGHLGDHTSDFQTVDGIKVDRSEPITFEPAAYLGHATVRVSDAAIAAPLAGQMGAVYKDTNGMYYFVPDGGGALLKQLSGAIERGLVPQITGFTSLTGADQGTSGGSAMSRERLSLNQAEADNLLMVDGSAQNDGIPSGNSGANFRYDGTGNDRANCGLDMLDRSLTICAGTADNVDVVYTPADGRSGIYIVDSVSSGSLTAEVRNTYEGGEGSRAFISGVSAGAITFSEMEIPCFTAGTMIETPDGLRDIGTLKVGDMVVTRDSGAQSIRWIGSRTVPAKGHLAPIRIRAGAVPNLLRDLLVPPQHRMLIEGYRAQLLFGEDEVLASAKYMIDDRFVTREEGGDVTYIHIIFDKHEIIYAEGAATESFHPGTSGLEALEEECREELFNLFPMMRDVPSSYGETARLVLRAHEAVALVS